MKLKKLAGLISLLCMSRAWAIEPFVIKDVRVEGIQRTEAGTVFSYLPVKVGDTLDDQKAAAAIRALYATGFFNDVRLKVEQGVLVVLVRERPSIASIELNGTKDLPKDQIKENMKYAGLAEARIFDKGVLDKAVQELKRQYVARGKYGVSVKTTVTELARNRVGIVFDVVEGEVSKIKQINLIGNHAFEEDELLELMKLSTPDWMSWFSKNDQYSKQKLSADMEAMRSFYMDNGYLEFNIDSTQVSITPDKKDIYITINLTEGEKYTVSRVGVSGNTLVAREDIEKLIQIKAGDTFSRKALTETSKKIGERLGQDGYAFANVNAIPELDKEKHQVGFNFVIDPGQRVYVRRINIAGNDKTRDEVIRREFRQVEGAWFDVEKIKMSKQRVDKLNFFAEVNMETPPVQGTADQVDVNVAVEEKSTGNISVGAGFSNNEGLTLMAGVTQANVFGSGNHISTQVNTSKINQVYSLSYTNPYFTDDGVSRGFDIYKRNTDSSSTAVSEYSARTLGAGIRFGVPIAEDVSISYGLAFEKIDIALSELSSTRLTGYVDDFGASNTSLVGTIGWGRDSRDSAIYTTEGTVQRAFAEIALPVLDMRYYKLNYQHQWFYPVSGDFTLLLNGEIGVAAGYGGEPVPFFKNFYAGGTGSVRGYDSYSLGPRDFNDQVLGGTKRVVGNAELLMPLPGSKEKSVRLSGFIDAGAVYGPGDLPGSAGLRYSTGVAVTWLSPMGPIKFSYAVPLNKQPVDRLQELQFTLGSMF
ncbi:MAG: outer membrane protein assembly factor BamA [Gallionellales bacterium RIFCSPLOWO2_12_FULL_59_22]|nr:MAG: outer membrane protein assembly factor BamA [Gallionellales bacterium RIFCSPLOWO2_02_FULL_59_110]OGT05180.1 MAG: outer membrane protein assembly factor BamA [Gallionellales bacterium RIFCSPLOWO2_02_58_13]OGT10776.1 MAG: outer membrane protein assembly factor BamA [Gallionellales bacterium RIFCSPLOWO2_12_FULL_59_22]